VSLFIKPIKPARSQMI